MFRLSLQDVGFKSSFIGCNMLVWQVCLATACLYSEVVTVSIASSYGMLFELDVSRPDLAGIRPEMGCQAVTLGAVPLLWGMEAAIPATGLVSAATAPTGEARPAAGAAAAAGPAHAAETGAPPTAQAFWTWTIQSTDETFRICRSLAAEAGGAQMAGQAAPAALLAEREPLVQMLA